MDRVQKRFDELNEKGEEILRIFVDAEGAQYHSAWFGREEGQYDKHKLASARSHYAQWLTSMLNLLSCVFSEISPTYDRFSEVKSEGYSQHAFREQLAIFRSAKEQFEGGYVFNVRKFIHAEVFDDELEQADHFLKLGHKVPAAVIAGTVLETSLRTLCGQYEIEAKSQISHMNDALKKADAYNQVRWRQIQGWGDIRNSAAHGKPDEFYEKQVRQMIDAIRDFVAGILT